MAMAAQQECGGEEGLAPEGVTSTGLSFFLDGKGLLLIGMGKSKWQVRR